MRRHFDDVLPGSIELFCLAVAGGTFTAAALAAGVTPIDIPIFAVGARAICRMRS